MIRKFLSLITTIITTCCIMSCSESDNTKNEYADWQNRNDAYFTQIYNNAKANPADWQIVRYHSKPESTTKPEDHIVMKMLKAGTGTIKPNSSNEVKIHYRGYLMPTDTHTTNVEGYPTAVGLKFDSSWIGDYNLNLMVPITGTVNSFTKGFEEALQQMREGERWLVYIPYVLGYDSQAQSSIPAYSTLIFDVTMVKITKP